MLQKLRRHITEGNRYQALEVYGSGHCVLTTFLHQKGEVELLSVRRAEAFDAILDGIDPKQPLLLTLNTDKVLKKLIAITQEASAQALVTNAFPNLDLNNFGYQLLVSGEQAVVCIAKNEVITKHIELLRNAKIEPFAIALGVAQLGALSTLFEGEVVGSDFRAGFQAGALTQFAASGAGPRVSLDLGGITLDNDQLLGFAHLLGHLSGKRALSNLGESNDRLALALANKRAFHYGVRAVLGFFLVLLLANFIAFEHYHGANQELEAQLQQGSVQDQTLKRLREEVLFKEDRLQRLSRARNSRVSKRLDEIGQGIPPTVSLDVIEYAPLAFPLAKDKPIRLETGALTLSGVSHDRIAFSVWSDNLELLDWIKQVEIIDYAYRSKSSAGFTLKLVLHEDR